ncbi:hypothetical protein O181_099274 [Austropuccinia psidii MF-1]|uniref:Retrotransposon gag domain-containing protein n=1 Tax=Austropuccinia psidii MF-1 TaxID=1389203 RepID=A0A9Q3JCD0_9BASI|nr:hypothetical protein [Austropuccinia psidii MF-1]
MEGAAPSRRVGMKSRRSRSFSGLLGGYPGMSEGARARLEEVENEEGEESVEEEDSGETEVEDALANAPEVPQGSNQPLFSQTEPSLLKMMEQLTHFMGQLTQAVTPGDNSKAPAFKPPSMKAPDSFDGTQAHKLRGFIKSCQLIFHNDPENFFSDRKKVLYSTSFLIDPSYLLNNWQLFETQLFTPFGDPNEVRESEQELDNLRMRESGHVSLYIADFRSLMSRIGDWGERAYIHVYRRGLASRLLDQLASHPGTFDTLEELMDVTLELDTRYHERQKEKGGNQEKKPPATGSNQQGVLKTHFQRGLTKRRTIRASNIKLQMTNLMLLSSITSG